MAKKYIDLGYANGWPETPEVLRKAHEAGFKDELTYYNGRGDSHYRCETDDTIITYQVDSSD